MKTCKKCGIEKKLDQFNKRSSGSKDGLQAYCRDCMRVSLQNPKNSLPNSNGNYMFEYGLTNDEYDELYKSQDGKCAVCKIQKEKLFVDHDHSTGRVRGLLCNKCNAGLGYFKDNKNWIKNAYNYLRRYEDINEIKNLLQDFPKFSYSIKRSARSSQNPTQNHVRSRKR